MRVVSYSEPFSRSRTHLGIGRPSYLCPCSRNHRRRLPGGVPRNQPSFNRPPTSNCRSALQDGPKPVRGPGRVAPQGGQNNIRLTGLRPSGVYNALAALSAVDCIVYGSRKKSSRALASTLLSWTLDSIRTCRTTLTSWSSGQAAHRPASKASNAKWDVTILGGILGSIFSFCQFLVSPYIGSLSDHYGRRPILLLTMIGNIISALLWLTSTSFGPYLLSRAIGGLSEGNVQLSIAVISDVSEPSTRSKSLALVGLAFSLCFTLGPSLGAWFAMGGPSIQTILRIPSVQKILRSHSVKTILQSPTTKNILRTPSVKRVLEGSWVKNVMRSSWAQAILRSPLVQAIKRTGVGLNVYAAPAAISLLLLVIETIYLAIALPETKTLRDLTTNHNQRRRKPSVLGRIHTSFFSIFSSKSRKKPALNEKQADSQAFRSLDQRRRRLAALAKIHTTFLFFFSGAEFTLTFLTYDLYGFTNAQNGRLLGFIGILSSLLQGGYTRRSKRAPLSFVKSGIQACILSLALLAALPFARQPGSQQIEGTIDLPSFLILYSAASALAYVSASVVNSLNTLASLECDEDNHQSSVKIASGKALGEFRSAGQLGRAFGPLFATALYWTKGPTLCYLVCAAGSVAVLMLTKSIDDRKLPALKISKSE